MNRLSAAIAAAALAAAPALAQPWHLTVTPSSPTWQDRVTIRVEGPVPGGCEAYVAAPAKTHFGGEQFRLDIPLLLDCAFPSSTERPLVADVDAGNLDPGQYQLRLRSDGETLEELVFQVFEVGEVQLTLPVLSTDAAPGSLTLSVPATSAPSASVTTVDHRIEVTLNRPLDFSQQELFDLEVPLPPLAAGDYEVRVLTSRPNQVPALTRGWLRVRDAEGCLPDDETLCLHAGRFRLSAIWRDFADRTGIAHPRVLPGNDGSGLLWFFGPDNTELTVKVLDGCAISGRWWAFVSSSSTVEYTLTVTDTATGATRSYRNSLGQVPRLIADTDAFSCP
jgi:hypothetical protein